jgi:hypothetical protein
VALSIALFLDEWKRWRYKPAIALEAGNEPPLSQKFMPNSDSEWIMLRLRICNEGNDVAENVEVHLVGVSKVRSGGVFETDPRFVQVRLSWSNGGGAMKEHLSPQTSGLVDLGKLTATRFQRQVLGAVQLVPPATLGPNVTYGLPWCRTDLKLCTEVDSPTDIWVYTPDSYRLNVIVSCKRGVFWKGAIDVAFAHVTEEHSPTDGILRLKYEHSVICGKPDPGLEVCNCG